MINRFCNFDVRKVVVVNQLISQTKYFMHGQIYLWASWAAARGPKLTRGPQTR